ncbi:MAG: Uma2 family endonuclease [Hyphomonadaceae bacterium]|nr:Uma2 family endonuclease [Hyphomonadaceae bacterium]
MVDLAPRPIELSEREFDRLLESGGASVLGRVELRRGRLVQMAPEYLPHGRLKTWIFKKLEAAIAAAGAPLVVDIEVSVRFAGRFRPLPDLTVWDGGPLKGPIPGEKARICVEIADESLADDIGPKRLEYAETGLLEYWVLDVNARALHQFWDLHEGDYRRRHIVRAGETLTSATATPLTLLFDPPTLP